MASQRRGLIAVLTAASLALLLGACGTDGLADVDCSAPLALTNADIAGGTTLPAGSCYLVDENLTLDDGIVTAEAGVELRFATGISFRIRSGGQLQLAGTADAPVTLTSQDPLVSWKGVQMDDSQGSSNDWRHAVVDRAGSDNWTGASYSAAAVYLTGSTGVRMNHVTISNSKAHGLVVGQDVELTFTAGIFDRNETPAYLHPQVVSAIAADAVFSNNTNDYLRVVFGNNDTVTETHSWAPHRYRIEDRFFVAGDLTIEPGATLQFVQGASMIVRPGATLSAMGTASERITFEGAANTRGFWQGIAIESGGIGVPATIGATFDHCIIRDAGGSVWSGNNESQAALYLNDTSAAQITNSRFENSARYAIWASRDARLPGFGDNSFSGNARVMLLYPDRVGELAGTSTISENDDDGIYVVFGNGDRVSVDASWKDLGVPYKVRDRFYVEAALTINAGVTIQFPQDQGVIVTEDGSITANGTAQARVSLEGQNAIASGYWKGIRFESNSTSNRLSNTDLKHAGSSVWTGDNQSDAAIFIPDGGLVSLNGVTIGPGGGYGIHLAANSSVVVCSDVNFTGLVKGNVWQDDPSPGQILAGCPQ